MYEKLEFGSGITRFGIKDSKILGTIAHVLM